MDIFGTNGNDSIDGTAGSDTIYGGDGNDTVVASPSNDTIYGGEGIDTYDLSVAGNAGAAVDLSTGVASGGGVGVDSLFGIENVRGGAGFDGITGTSGDNTFFASGGSDIINGRGGADTYDASNQSASVTVTFVGGFASGAGIGAVVELISIENARGGSGSDFLIGDSSMNVLEGNGGSDELYGGDGNDALYGGEGSDFLYGEDDADTLDGGEGADQLYGGDGNDVLRSGPGDAAGDSLMGDFGNDTLEGGDGADNLFGGADNDLIFGGDGADLADGSTGSNTVDAGAGDDVIRATLGNDSVNGSLGTDRLVIRDDGGAVLGLSGIDLSGVTALGGSADGTVLVDGRTLQIGSIEVIEVASTDPSGASTFIVVHGMSIQAAIDAAGSGDRIVIKPGTYAEQIVVDGKDNLIIEAETSGTVTITAPTTLAQTATSSSGREVFSIVTVEDAASVTIRGIEVDGLGTTAGLSGANPNNVGVYFRNASGSLIDVDVTGIRDPYETGTTAGGNPVVSGIQRGVGVQVDNDSLLAFTMSGGSITDFQKNAAVFGFADLNVTGVTITGGGAQTINAQNGIQAFDSTGTIGNNTITGIGYAGPAFAYSGALLLYGNTDLDVTNNVIMGSNGESTDAKVVGIFVLDFGTPNSGGTISGNTISFVDDAIDVSGDVTPDGILIENNTVSDIDETDPFAIGLAHYPTETFATPFSIEGTASLDFIGGGAAGDTLSGLAGDDTFEGNGGDDLIDGGADTDTASYAGGRAGYSVTFTTDLNGVVTGFSAVTDTDGGNGDEGIDSLTSIERLTFDDAAIDLADPVQLFRGGVLFATFETIQDAVDAAIDLDTIRLAAGTYDEIVTVDVGVSILGPNEGLVGFDAGTTNANAARGAEAVVTGFVYVAGFTGGTLDGVTVSAEAGNGLNPGRYGIDVQGVAGLTVQNTIIENSFDDAVRATGPGTGTGPITLTGNLIRNAGSLNDVVNVASFGLVTIDGNAIAAVAGATGDVIAVETSGTATIVGNLLTGVPSEGILLLDTAGASITNNTIEMAAGSATAIAVSGAVTGTVVSENDLSTVSPGVSIGIGVGSDAAATDGVSINTNLYSGFTAGVAMLGANVTNATVTEAVSDISVTGPLVVQSDPVDEAGSNIVTLTGNHASTDDWTNAFGLPPGTSAWFATFGDALAQSNAGATITVSGDFSAGAPYTAAVDGLTVTGGASDAVGTLVLGAGIVSLDLAGSLAGNVTGNAAANSIGGSDAANTLSGEGGNDRLDAGGGNDVLSGGAGTDTAEIGTARAASTVTKVAPGTYVVSGADGTDTLSGVEGIRFDDVAYTVELDANSPDFAGAFTRFDQSFETDAAGFLTEDNGWSGSIDVVASGTGGITSLDGTSHALFAQTSATAGLTGPFSRFDGYRQNLDAGLRTEVAIWLDPAALAAGEGFDFSVAANNASGGFLRDFIFHVTKDTSTGQLLVGGSNNTNFNPREDLDTLNHVAVTTAGWYRFEHKFYENETGRLEVAMNLYDASGNWLFTEIRSDAGDLFSNFGGNRYLWFTNIDVAAGIAVDGITLETLDTNPVELFSGNTVIASFPTIQDAIDAALPGQIVEVDAPTGETTVTVGVENLTLRGPATIPAVAVTLDPGILAFTAAGEIPVSITGNDGGNTLAGNAADNAIDGGLGIDTVVLGGLRADFNIGVTTTTNGFVTAFTLTDDENTADGDEGTDTLTSAEKLQFDDVTLDLGQPVQLFRAGELVGTFGTIQGAVDAASAGDTVLVSDGTYSENVVIDVAITLLSVNGRGATTIEGIAGVGALGTIRVLNGVNGVTIGDADQGFHIVGFDNGIGGVENAAVYLQGLQDAFTLRGNEIEANGEHGLLSEFGGALTNAVIDGNEFSGQTFQGAQPGGIGFGTQFDAGNNVPRQLVVIGPAGTGTNASSNITFTNNLVSGTTGGISSVDNVSEQGNTMVTIDANGATISDNAFTGTTARFATALRARGPNTDIENNSFDNSSGGDTRGVFIQDQGAPGSYAGNTFTGGTDGDLFQMTPGADSATGGGGSDILLGLGGADTIDAGAGTDTVSGGTGNDSLDGGSEVDVAVYAGPLAGYAVTYTLTGGVITSFDTVTDNDTAALDEGADTLANIEVLQFGDVTLTAGLPVLLFDASDVLIGTFATIQAAVDAATGGVGETVRVAAGTYAETVTVTKSLTIEGANAGIAGSGLRGPGSVIDGKVVVSAAGVTLDGLDVAPSAPTAGGADDLILVSGAGAVLTNLAVTSGQNALGEFLFAVRITGADPTVTDSTITRVGTGTTGLDRGLIRASGTDNATITGNVLVNGSIGITSGTGAGVTTGFVVTGNAVTPSATNADWLFLAGPGFGPLPDAYQLPSAQVDLSGNTITGPDGLQLRGTNLADDFTAYATTGADNFFGFGGADTMAGGAGADTIDAGAGDDLVLWSVGDGNDTVTGGADTDTAAFTGAAGGGTAFTVAPAGASVAVTADGTETVTLTGVEDLVLGAGAGGTVSVTIAGDFSGTGLAPTTIFVNGGAGVDVVDASGLTSAHNVVFDAGDGADTIDGGAGDDRITGDEGNDAFAGGTGIDTAEFAGNLADYDIDFATGQVEVTDTDTALLDEGTDTLDGTEILEFADARVLVVGSDGFPTLQAAVDAANAGDTIIVLPGTWVGDTTIPAGLDGLTILGVQQGVAGTDAGRGLVSGTGESTIEGVIHVLADNVTVDGLRVAEGGTAAGLNAGIIAGAAGLTVANSVFYRSGTVDNDGFNGIVNATGGVAGGLAVAASAFAGWAIGVFLQADAAGAAVTDSSLAGNRIGMAIDGYAAGSGLAVSGNTFDNVLADLGIGAVTGSVTGLVSGNDFFGPGVLNLDVNLPVGTVVNNEFFGSTGADVLTDDANFPLGAVAAARVGGNTVFGFEGADSIATFTGNDTIEAGDGDDTVSGGAGDDRLVGGTGTDTVSFATETANVTVNLASEVAFSSATGVDQVIGFENIIGGSGNDLLIGSTGANLIVDGLGNDTVSAGDGADRVLLSVGFLAPANNDSLDGGTGIDTIDASLASSAVTILLELGVAAGDDIGTDAITGFENAIGGAGNDVLTGNSAANTLTGNAGQDIIRGAGGADVLFGGTNNDTLIGGAGADSLAGGDGFDIASYADATALVQLSSTAGLAGDAAGDTFSSIEKFVLTGFNDVFLGGAGGVTVDGGNGDDLILGGTGSDSLGGGEGTDVLSGQDGGVADTLDGGAGIDLAYYYGATTALVVDFAVPGNNVGEHTADTFISIEGFVGAIAFSNDMTGDANGNYLTGGNLADTIRGGAGNDQLSGNGGADLIFGGDNNDALIGGGGNDTLTGGTGIDVFYMRNGAATDTVTDWSEGDDFFLFFQMGLTSYANLTFTDVGTDVRITSALNTSFTIVVQNTELTDLDQASNFIFIV